MRRLAADVCIFGAGAAGLYLAERLSRQGDKRVALVEAGPINFANRQEPYKVRSTRRNHLGANEARVTAFGGATNVWGGGLIRPLPADLQALEGLPDTAWPLNYDDLSPHFAAVNAQFGHFETADQTHLTSFDTSAARLVTRSMYFLPFSKKNFAGSIGAKLSKRPAVQIMTGVSPPEHLYAEDGRLRYVGIETHKGKLRLEADDFVIAAGVLNSALLTRSLLQQMNRPRPAVWGQALHDHISIPLYDVCPSDRRMFSRRFSYRFTRGFMVLDRLEISSALPGGQGGHFHFTFDFEGCALLRAIRASLRARQQITGLTFPSIRELGQTVANAGDAARILYERVATGALYIPPDVLVKGVLDIEQAPDNSCRLSAQHDSPDIELSWDIGSRDVQHAADCVRSIRSVMHVISREGRFNFRPVYPDPDVDADAFHRFVNASGWDTYHLAGGLRMGTDPDRSVVSPDLSVHGVSNLFVLSTATFPRSGASNPTFLLLALADRLAERLTGSA
jgi:choline dehydrogenase-like flavoprotein